MGTLDGQKVMIVGGSSGMGLAIAESVCDEGGQLVLAARGESRLERVAVALEERGGIEVVRRSLRIEDRVAMRQLMADVAPLDHVVLPGSTVQPVTYDELSDQVANGSFASKFWGPFWTVFDAREHMPSGGSFVMFSGVASRRPVPGYVMGACIDGAIDAATRSLALELGPLGLRINTISPGFVMTPLFANLHDAEDVASRVEEARRRLPVGRVGTPEEAASVAMMFMTNGFVTGQVLVLDGGLLAAY